MAKITYTDKVTLNEQPSISAENKVTDDDMNEIKNVVNTNDDNVGTLSNLKTTAKTSTVTAINELVDGETYSTTEVKTNRTWIDGKPIYRLVVDYTIARSTNAWNAVNTLNNIDKIFIKEVTAFVGNEYYLNVWQTYSFYYNKSDSKIYERHTSNYYEGNHMFIVFEYTKTTD